MALFLHVFLCYCTLFWICYSISNQPLLIGLAVVSTSLKILVLIFIPQKAIQGSICKQLLFKAVLATNNSSCKIQVASTLPTNGSMEDLGLGCKCSFSFGRMFRQPMFHTTSVFHVLQLLLSNSNTASDQLYIIEHGHTASILQFTWI